MGDQMENETLCTLYEAHVQSLLKDLQGDALLTRLSEEVSAFYEWSKNVSVVGVLPKQWVIDRVIRAVQAFPLSEQQQALIVDGVEAAITAEINKENSLGSVVSREQYDRIVTNIAEHQKLREDFIRGSLSSPVYGSLISDVLYHGIKDYVLSENPLARKIPGVASLVKMGKASMNKAMPKLESFAETTVKNYISGNIHRTIKISEKFLIKYLDAKNINEIAGYVWDKFEGKQFSFLSEYVRREEIAESVSLGFTLAQELRDMEYLKVLITSIVDAMYEIHGDKSVYDILGRLDITEDYVTGLLKEAAPAYLKQSNLPSYLEQRIRKHLGRFYSSSEVLRIIESVEA
jgi:hypothetical protein